MKQIIEYMPLIMRNRTRNILDLNVAARTALELSNKVF